MKYYHLCFTGGLAAMGLSAQAENLTPKSPHIILIMTDQQRADALGCAGNEAVISPNIDRLAAEGHLFNNAYTSAPSSTPARAGLLTGMSPWHHGLLGYGKVAEHYTYEMPRMLKELGYKTLGIGKMHWDPQNALHGFDATIIDESGRVESPYFMSDYRKWFAVEAFGLNPDSTGVGWNAHRAKAYALPERLHPTRWTGDKAVEAIQGYSSDAPLFLKVSFARPHSPYDPPQRWLDRYQDRDVPAPWVGEWCSDRKVDLHPEATPEAYAGNYGVEYAKNSRKYYYAAISFIDEQVGRIITELKKKGMYDNALICFVSDHGDMLGDHHLWRKTYAYEGSAAIPFIVKTPRSVADAKKPGTKIDAPVELRDLLPTFLALNHSAIPTAMDGMSLLSLLDKKPCSWRPYIDIEHATAYWADNYWCALTDGKIKYIWFCHSGCEQLFDLTKDPCELKELSTVPAYRSKLEEMRKAMVAHLQERGEEWVKDGQLVVRKKNMLYSPNYPLAPAWQGWGQSVVCQSGTVDLSIKRQGESDFASGFSCFSLNGHFVWCGSAIQSKEDGKYYLFYSAMESGKSNPKFVDAWLLGSKIGVAVSDSPYGGYRNLGFVYNKDGYRPDKSSWDSQTVSNTHVKWFDGKYYLYYCGSTDPGELALIKGKLSPRDRIQQNQKLGVICFNSVKELMEGKYSCNEQPLLAPRTRVKSNNILEPSPEGVIAKPDNIIMVNPAVVYRPYDKKYLLYFKGNVYDPSWRGVHGVAMADHPEGPYTVMDNPVFEFETKDNRKLNAEDPYVWYHPNDKCFYAIFKDFTGGFTKGEPGLAIMSSKDGLKWELPAQSLFMKKEFVLKNGEHIKVDRLERPQLLLDTNDNPIALYSACSITPLDGKSDGSSFNIQIPLVKKQLF